LHYEFQPICQRTRVGRCHHSMRAYSIYVHYPAKTNQTGTNFDVI
jgi:hypothetical protein